MSGIPTLGVRGIQFRSRIEAQWAYIFEKFGWNWEYEPIDLIGYIPYFIINFGNTQILIEIKGDINIWENFEEHKEKIIKSGWKGTFAIFGAVYKISDCWGVRNCPIVGVVFYYMDDYEDLIEDDIIIRKEKGNKWNLGGDMCVYDICGGYWKDVIESKTDFDKIWVEAKNSVQWKGNQNITDKK